MCKSIAGAGMLPFNIGGFCVDALNYNGKILYQLNIYKQRSHHTYDLIDTKGNIYQYVNITYKDKNKKELDPTQSTIHNANIIDKNTFFMKTNSAFVTSIHNKKIKLNNGDMLYKPWELYYCNTIDKNEADPQYCSIAVLDPYVLSDGNSILRIKFIIHDSNDEPILNYDTSKIHYYTAPTDNPFTYHAFENLGNGEYILPVTSSTTIIRYIQADIGGIEFGKCINLIINFVEVLPQ